MHDDLVVLVDDVERDGLALGRRRLRRRDRDRDRLAGVDAMAGIADRAPAETDLAGENQRLDAGAGQLGDAGGEHAVKAVAGLRVGGDELFPSWLTLRHERSVPSGPLW